MKGVFEKIIGLLIAVAACLAISACADTTDGDKDVHAVGEAATFVTIDINPSIELTLDEDGFVATVYGSNDDGKVLLYGEVENIVGKDFEAAAEYITNLAVELDYIEEGHEIVTSVLAATEADAEAIRVKLDAKIKATATELGVTVTTTKEAAYALLRELSALKERYPDNADIQSLTPEKFKLVMAATEEGEITVTAAAALDNEALIKKVNEAHSKIAAHATALYNSAKAEAEKLYEIAMGVVLDGSYNAVYAERLPSMLTHPEYINTIYYGAVYQAYMTTARTYRSIDDIMEFGEAVTSYVLKDETVAAIAAELELADTSVLEDANGDITVASVVAYVDEFLDAHELGDEAEERIDEILDTAEDAAEMAALASERYARDLANLKDQLTLAVSTVNGMIAPFKTLLSEEGKAELEACLADLNASAEKLSAMMAEGLTEDELEELADEAEEKAEAMLEKIEADLTEAELERVAEIQREAEAQIKNLRDQFSARLTEAENAAKAEIERRRAERANKAA